MSVTGHFIPPALIFKRKCMVETLFHGAPEGTVGYPTENGWIDRQTFTKWLGHFIAHARPTPDNKVLIILDNHISHINLQAIYLARKHGIVMISIPPHTSHKLQPLDRTVYGPMKVYYHQEVDKWMVTHPGMRVDDYKVAALFRGAFLRAATAKNACSGFSCTGIWPLNSDVFGDEEFVSAEVTEILDPSEISPGCTFKAASVLTTPIEQGPPIDETVALSERVSVQVLSPLPRTKATKRKRKGQAAECLTSSPFKNLLTTKGLGKRKPTFSKTLKKPACSSTVPETEFCCIYCSELYGEPPTEDWIECRLCREWAHEKCAGLETADTLFTCDLCK
jgi:hypothetical protein